MADTIGLTEVEDVDVPDGRYREKYKVLSSTAAEIDAAASVGSAWVLDYGLCVLLGEGPAQA